jgi:hypothetical protein
LITLRHGVECANPLSAVLEFVEAYSPAYDSQAGFGRATFDETDLSRANRGGARISAAEQAAILERRRRIERALRSIEPNASLAARTIPWGSLTRLFEAFAGIRGIGFSKMTKALHPKRPALIPMLDSVVQAYLSVDNPSGSFGEHATALVRTYKRDLDRNHRALRDVQRELASRGYRLTEVRILDVLIWSANATARGQAARVSTPSSAGGTRSRSSASTR